jgi:hypothetical protein
MSKRLLFVGVLSVSNFLAAQFSDAGYHVINDVNKPRKPTEITNRSTAKPTPCTGDTSTFPMYGSTAYNTVTIRRGSALGQFYDAPVDMTISGFRFFGFAVTPTNPARDVKIRLICNLYKAGLDSLPSGAPIASDTITVDTVQGANILLSRIQRDISFGKNININFPYIIAVECDSTDVSAAVVSNSWANGDGKFRNLCVGSVSGIWYRCLQLNIGGTTFNSHMQFYPFVNYSLGTDFTIRQACYPNLDTLYFPNHSRNNLLSSIYYNRYVYSDIERFCHRWNYDYRVYMNSIDGAYKPLTKSNIRVELISTLYPYTGTYCQDTSVRIAYFSPTRPAIKQEAKACRGTDHRIDIDADANAEVWWFKKQTDTTPFLKARFLDITDAQKHDTFFVKAVNEACHSTFLPIYFRVYDYPKTVTVRHDSICSGAAANLSVETDLGQVHWYISPNLGKPFHTGKTLKTSILNEDTTFYVLVSHQGCDYALGAQSITAFVGDNFAPLGPEVPQDTFVCLNQSREITLSVKANDQNDTVFWYNQGTGGIPIQNGTEYVLKLNQRGHVTVFLESWNGTCGSGRTPLTIYVKDIPKVSESNGATVCENEEAVIYANVPFGDVTWFSDKADNKPLHQGKIAKVSGYTGNKYFYIKTYEDACIAEQFDSVLVVFNEIPKITSTEAPSVCARADGFMRVNVSAGNVSWFIDSLSDQILHQGSLLDLGMVLSNRIRWFEAENEGCKTERQPLNLIVKPRPTSGFTYTIQWQHKITCTPITTAGLTLEWFWGDGTSKVGLPATHQYDEAGEYTIRLIATSNANGCKDTVDIPVSINHVSIKAIGKQKDISAYPNPAQAGDVLTLKGVQQGTMEWADATGRILGRSEVSQEKSDIPESLKKGWYFITVRSQQEYWTGKIWID